MLDSFRKLFNKPAPERDVSDVMAWARGSGRGFKRVRGEDGFVVDGAIEGMPWRLEWGPAQRDYIGGHELRLRMELALPHDMQMLVLSRALMERLERATYEQFTDSMQTQIGAQAPEEMRWLVMFPKVDLVSLKSLRARFGAVASVPAAGLAWLEGPLAESLMRSADRLLHTPDVADIAAALGVFETAVTQALAAAAGFDGPGGQWHSTSSTAWQSLHSEELRDLDKPG
jgi:hypothetical protein